MTAASTAGFLLQTLLLQLQHGSRLPAMLLELWRNARSHNRAELSLQLQ
jgi:hypothetical protein